MDAIYSLVRARGAVVFALMALLQGCARPEGPLAQTRPHSVTLTWKPSVSKVREYVIYRADEFDAPPKLLATVPADVTEYVDKDVVPGHIYYYSMKSVDVNKLKSVYSEQVVAPIPSR
jgi:fibronectin type 3 domain-containing protein